MGGSTVYTIIVTIIPCMSFVLLFLFLLIQRDKMKITDAISQRLLQSTKT